MYDIYTPSWLIKKRFEFFIKTDFVGSELKDSIQQISKQNWTEHYSPKQNKRFHNIFKSFGSKYLKHLKDISGYDYDFTNAWYQVYKPNSNDWFGWHDHAEGHIDLSGIFYIKLRDPKIVTHFNVDGQCCIPQVKEGQIITFESHLQHCCPPNNTNTEKIVVSFNLQKINK